jgi:Undecaprenyl-phosphate glucose phosphotransferase
MHQANVVPASRISPETLVDCLRLIDAVSLALSGFLAHRVWMAAPGHTEFLSLAALVAVAATVALFQHKSIYQTLYRAISPRGFFDALIRIAVVAGAFLVVSLLVDPVGTATQIWFLYWLGLCAPIFAATRLTMTLVTRRLVRSNRMGLRIAVFGAGRHGRHVVSRLLRESDPGTGIIGIFDDRKSRVPREIEGHRVVGGLDRLVECAQSGAIDEIIIALPWTAEARIINLCDRLKFFPGDVCLSAEPAPARATERVTSVGGVPLLELVGRPLTPWQLLAKATLDYSLASLALLATLPLLTLIAAVIRIDSKGPVLFRQPREGFGGTHILVFKFRTMKVADCDQLGTRQSSANDPRVTRVGRFLRKTSLDELPQLFNVLRGEMSLVGPRPHPLDMRTNNLRNIDIVSGYAARRRIKPGITGWAQVNGSRGPIEDESMLHDRLRYDLFYIENWALRLDLNILFKTVLQTSRDLVKLEKRRSRAQRRATVHATAFRRRRWIKKPFERRPFQIARNSDSAETASRIQ